MFVNLNMPEIKDRRLAAIMFADIVGYSRMMNLDEDRTLLIKNDFEQISAPIITSFNGQILKNNGDEIFCEFNSAKNAVDASLEIQKVLSKYNDSQPENFKLLIRIGIHIGDIVVQKDGDIHGDGVNVAARIQPIANPGGICVSSSVQDALQGHPQYNIIEKGKHDLKNILKKYSIYEIETGVESIPITPINKIKVSDKRGSSSKQLTYIGEAIRPAISSDGKFIAFYSSGSILMQDVDGGKEFPLMTNLDTIYSMSWSKGRGLARDRGP